MPREIGPFLGTAVLPFALILYLGLKGGGYDSIVRNEVGIALWWILLIGAAAGLLPLRRPPLWSLLALGLLLAFAAWTTLAIGWSESAERTVAEVARVLALLGVFAVAVALQGPKGLRRTVGAAAAAVAVIAAAALGSRLQPSWFPDNETARFLDTAESRLSWPLNYWNGLAALMAIGAPLLLSLASAARTVLIRALAAAAIPVVTLALFLTLSRGGAAELIVALVVFVVLASHRLAVVPTVLAAAAGSALLIVAAAQRDELTDGLSSAPALTQGDELTALTLIVALGTGLVVAAGTLAHRSGLVSMPEVPRRTAVILTALAGLVAAVTFFATDGPGAVDRGFEEFKSAEGSAGNDLARFQSVNGSLRWQIWTSAREANASEPWLGIGPGTFEYWWSRNGTESNFVRDAHSLYLETLGEAGIIGLTLLALALLALVTGGLARLRLATGGERILLAGALASMSAFVVAAAIDWVWELTVLPVLFLLVAAAAIAGRRRRAGESREALAPQLPIVVRAAVALLSVAAIVGLAIPLSSTQELRASQQAAEASAVDTALERANSAADLQPFAASPRLQRAQVLELDGRLAEASAAARKATLEEPTNWRTWFVLARIEAARDRVDPALNAFLRARELNPRSPVFQEQP